MQATMMAVVGQEGIRDEPTPIRRSPARGRSMFQPRAAFRCKAEARN